MADRAQIEKFEAACEAIKKLASQKEHYIKRERWGELTFEDIKDDIDRIFWLVEEIGSLPIAIVNDAVINETESHLSQIREYFRQIDEFILSSGDPNSTRNSIASHMKTHIQGATSAMGPWMPFLALRAGKIQN